MTIRLAAIAGLMLFASLRTQAQICNNDLLQVPITVLQTPKAQKIFQRLVVGMFTARIDSSDEGFSHAHRHANYKGSYETRKYRDIKLGLETTNSQAVVFLGDNVRETIALKYTEFQTFSPSGLLGVYHSNSEPDSATVREEIYRGSVTIGEKQYVVRVAIPFSRSDSGWTSADFAKILFDDAEE